MSKLTIGVLAGMGPRSTSPFLELVLDECQKQYGAKYDIDYPHIMIYSLPTPFYIDRKTDENALKKSIQEGVDRLGECGVDLIGIPCNSAHDYFDFITKNSKVPVLNIVTETLKVLDEGMKVAVYATEMTMKSGLYQAGLKDKRCEHIVEPDWQSRINEIILRIKNGQDLAETKRLWNELVQSGSAKGVEAIIIACTDLNVVLEDRDGTLFIDSAKALASGLVCEYLKMKN